MPRRIGLIVGNGLAIDLRQTVEPLLADWDTQRPLQWSIATPGQADQPFLEALPHFDKAIREVRETDPEIRDFDLIAKVLDGLPSEKASWTDDQGELVAEIRQFLAIAFSHYQEQVNQLNLEGWRWRSCIESIRDYVAVAVSFNYDLLLETLFQLCGIQPRRFALREETTGVWLLKPHGSIDFAPNDLDFSIAGRVGYPLPIVVDLNNYSVRRLRESELTEPRLAADITLPSEYSPYGGFQWVRPGYEWFTIGGAFLTEVWIIGLSYWKCDRQEINYILRCVPRSAEIKVVNPKWDDDLIDYLRIRFSKITLYSTCPESDTAKTIRTDVAVNPDTFTNETVRLTDLIFDSEVIVGLKFDHCRIIGPCVVYFAGSTVLGRNKFEAPRSISLWETSEQGPGMGCIQLRDCTFLDCEFSGIGIAGPPDILSRIFLTEPEGAG